jgi:hypothetical protein
MPDDPKQQTLLTDPPPSTEKAAPPPADPAKPAAQAKPPEKPPEETTLLTGEGEPPKDEPKGTPPPGQPLQLKPPVGVNADDPGFVKFKQFAEAKKLSQEQAQEALDLYAAQLSDASAKAKQSWAQMKADWAKASRADPEIGGERLPVVLASAKRAIDKYGTPALRDALQTSGLGNHPEIVRFFARVGKTLSEDTFAGGHGTPPAPKQTEQDRLKAMYPTMFPKEQ